MITSRATTSLRIFTRADLGDRPLFRAVRVDVRVAEGEGKIWLDVSRGRGFEMAWQRHVNHLAEVGRKYFTLEWGTTDLFVSARGPGVVLDGASASIPLFVAWIALLHGKPLPEPFFAAGCAVQGDLSGALSPAPRELVQGKLEMAEAITAQARIQNGRPSMWIPGGSDYDAALVPAISVVEVATLQDAARSVLGLNAREPAACEARS